MTNDRRKWYANWRNWTILVSAIAIGTIVATRISPDFKAFLGDAVVVAWLAFLATIFIGVGQPAYARWNQRRDQKGLADQAVAGANARINNVLNGIPQARWALAVPTDVPDFDFLKKIIEWKDALDKIDRTAIQVANPSFANAVTLCIDTLEAAEWRLKQAIGDPEPTVTRVLDFLTETLLPFRKTTADAINALASNAAPERQDGHT
ncbi:hypothetical protein [Achromobacter aegrifaciens]|uniref:hypothetical protein n=1 Tax=Achromobacter aegrifaciens TaxID=1287736 RepID=UPI0006C84522|nr:hypothetical protein [Achromobacter aegrifaciens]